MKGEICKIDIRSMCWTKLACKDCQKYLDWLNNIYGGKNAADKRGA